MDSDFWGGLVLKLSVTEPIVRHAVLAMSRLHEHLSTNMLQPSGTGPAFVYSEYGKSIAALQKWKSSDGPAVPLLASVLYTCVEFLLDNEPGARMHILQGRQIMQSIEDDSSHMTDMVKRELVPMYARLGLAAFLYGGHPPSLPSHLTPSLELPARFQSMTEARGLLYHVLDEALRFSTSIQPKLYTTELSREELQSLQSSQQALLNKLNGWNATFTVFTSGIKLTHPTLCTQNLLLIYYNTAVIWLSVSLSREEVSFDAHTAGFASIISLASAIIHGSQKGTPLHTFSFETELIAPIYWTAQKCRQPMLRRAAVQLLMKDELKYRRENLWHSNEAIAIAMRTIELEEENIGKPGHVNVPVFTDASHSAGTPSSDSSSNMSFKSCICVPIFHPPTLSVEQVEEEERVIETTPLDFGTSPFASTDAVGFQTPLLASRILDVDANTVQLDSPYGIPENARVKNVLIGSRDNTGVWVTIFRDPELAGQEWDVQKEFIPF